jgi:hypothetical protein
MTAKTILYIIRFTNIQIELANRLTFIAIISSPVIVAKCCSPLQAAYEPTAIEDPPPQPEFPTEIRGRGKEEEINNWTPSHCVRAVIHCLKLLRNLGTHHNRRNFRRKLGNIKLKRKLKL